MDGRGETEPNGEIQQAAVSQRERLRNLEAQYRSGNLSARLTSRDDPPEQSSLTNRPTPSRGAVHVSGNLQQLMADDNATRSDGRSSGIMDEKRALTSYRARSRRHEQEKVPSNPNVNAQRISPGEVLADKVAMANRRTRANAPYEPNDEPLLQPNTAVPGESKTTTRNSEMNALANGGGVGVGVPVSPNGERAPSPEVQPMLEAHLVDDDENRLMATASQVTWCSENKPWVAAGIVVFILGVALAVIFPFLFRSSSDSLLSPLEQSLQDLILQALPSSDAALQNQTTAQSKARSWLANNDTQFSTYDDSQKLQRYALATLYFSTNGHNWTKTGSNWLSESPECQWTQLNVTNGSPKAQCNSNGEIVELSFVNNGMVGQIPPDLALLSNSLRVLNFTDNALTGIVSGELGRLEALEVLVMPQNRLIGSVPKELGSLRQLALLNMSDNQLTGSLPTSIGDLSQTRIFDVSRNSILGGIPSETGSMFKLEYFDVSFNALSETIPSEIGLLQNLRVLDISVNSVCGTLSSELGLLSSLQMWNMTNNLVARAIPSEIGALSSLRIIDWSSNTMSGTIPEFNAGSIAPNITYIDFSDNFLSGQAFERLRQAQKLEYVNLRNNLFDGSFSRVTTMTSLQYLDLANNSFGGPVPSEMYRLSNLEHLVLYGNGILRSLPTELGLLAKLTALDVGRNQISGTLPSEVGNLVNLQQLDLGVFEDYSPKLGGPIPSEIGRLLQLKSLNLSHCSFSATIPREIAALSGLTSLDMGLNALSGPIVPDIGSLHLLEKLDLSHNSLTGALPKSLANLTALVSINLHRNTLSSSIPTFLGSLVALSHIDLRQNRLLGPVPSSIGLLTHLTHLDLSLNNGLSGTFPPIASLTLLESLILYLDSPLTFPLEHVLPLENLKALDLSVHIASGSISQQFRRLTSLKRLRIVSNRVTGTIPSELGLLTSIENLYFSLPSVTGTFPNEIANLKSLWRFIWKTKLASGTIPSGMSSLTLLESITMSLDVDGPIPDITPWTNMQFLDIEETRLTGSIPQEVCGPFRTMLVNCTLVDCACCCITERESSSPSSTATLLPTAIPTISPVPTGDSAAVVTLLVQLDGSPSRTSWEIKKENDGLLVAQSREYGEVGDALRLIRYEFILEKSEMYVLQVSNTNFLGAIDCYNGETYFRLYLGREERVTNLLVSAECGSESPASYFFRADITGVVGSDSPSSSPSITLVPTSEGTVIVTLVLQLDRFPGETSWTLSSSDGELIAQSDPYTEKEQLIKLTFRLQESTEYIFIIMDSAFDGFSYGSGYYILYIGENQSPETILVDSTVQDVTETLEGSKSYEFIPSRSLLNTDAPSFSPSSSSAPSVEGLAVVTLVLQLDKNPHETEWVLALANGTIVSTSEPYTSPSKKITIEFLLDESLEYVFQIVDFNSGICCTFGKGYYRLFLGRREDEGMMIIDGDGRFEIFKTHNFIPSKDHLTESPSSRPSRSFVPSAAGIAFVTLVLHLDNSPIETGWVLEDDSGTIVALSEPYTISSVVRVEMQLQDSMEYKFTIIDEYADGICCEYGDGSYRLYLGRNEMEEMILVDGSGRFGASASHSFFANETSLTGTSPPSSSPSSSPAPSLRGTATVTLVLQLDRFPSETSWKLSSENGTVVAEVTETSYGFTFREKRVETELVLDSDVAYSFAISDSDSDGICCLFGEGYYALYLGKQEDDDALLFRGDGRFGAGQSHSFIPSLVDSVS